jgi:hypothetical protein
MQIIDVVSVKPLGRKWNLPYCDYRLDALINKPLELVRRNWQAGAGQLALCNPAKVGGSIRYHPMETPIGIADLCQTAI